MQRIVCKLVRETGPKISINGPSDVAREVAKHMMYHFGDEPREVFCVFHLSRQNDVVGWEIVTTGILDSTLVHPREIFRSAIVRNASTIIVSHNHPSGSIAPSAEDIAVTETLAHAGRLLGIQLLDHVIVGGGVGDDFTSIAHTRPDCFESAGL